MTQQPTLHQKIVTALRGRVPDVDLINAATIATEVATTHYRDHDHQIAQQLRHDTRLGYRPTTTRYQHYMEAADHIDPEVQT